MKYGFSGFQLDPARHRLLGADGQPVNLSSRVFDTLLYMVEHPGELLDKAELMQAVWPDTVVEENNLNQAVTALRKALGEKPGDHRFILTEPGRGYRFVAKVEALDDTFETSEMHPGTDPAADVASGAEESGSKSSSRRKPLLIATALVVIAALAVGYLSFRQHGLELDNEASNEAVSSVLVSPPPDPQSVAVLPFADMSPGGDQAYFADGIAEELLNHLSRLRGLHVAGRTSSFYFRDREQDLRAIGRALNVAHILEGSVRKAGDRVRISVQLVKAADGYHVWSQSFERDLDDIFAIQDEIATAVADALSVSLGVSSAEFAGGKPPPFEAYDAFLEARALLSRQGRENYARAIGLLESAVRMDPEYADAWRLLSTAYWSAANIWIADRSEEYLEKARQANARVLELSPDSPAYLSSLATRSIMSGDWLEAERALQRAVSLAPADPSANMFYGFFLRTVGRPGDSIDYYRRAIQVEPLALSPSFGLTIAFQSHGDTEAALKQLEHSESLLGDDALMNGLAVVLAMELDDRAMVDDYLDRIEASPSTPQAARDFSIALRARWDNPEAAREYLRAHYRDPDYQDPLSKAVIALYASYFDDPDLALEVLRESQAQGSLLIDALWREVFAVVRRHPGFKDIIRNVHMDDYWRESGNWGEFCRPLGDDDFECR